MLDVDLSEISEEIPKILTNNDAHDLLVEQIGSNNVAVFQTLINSVAEKEDIKEENIKSQVSIFIC